MPRRLNDLSIRGFAGLLEAGASDAGERDGARAVGRAPTVGVPEPRTAVCDEYSHADGVCSLLAVWRILRCSPLSRGGVDRPPVRRKVYDDDIQAATDRPARSEAA